MKEIIRELMEKAMRPTGLDGIGGPYMELDQEIFAREIVQECASIYERIDNGNLVEGTDDYLLALQRVFFSKEK